METINNDTTLLELYLKSLSKKEKQSYEIAKTHLGMSFDLKKSVGYLKWKTNLENNIPMK